MVNYPNGRKKESNTSADTKKNKQVVYSNRGMSLEEDIDDTNSFYVDTSKAIIHKKPTPVQIVRVHYPKRSAAVITEGYFKQASTTDYNGIYKGRHIDFEAKETKNKTSFPLSNIHEHQVHHMQTILEHDGISFIIIRFSTLDETYLLSAEHLLTYWQKQLDGGRKSIRYKDINKHGWLIPFTYQARVNYLRIVDNLYF